MGSVARADPGSIAVQGLRVVLQLAAKGPIIRLIGSPEAQDFLGLPYVGCTGPW